MLWYYIVLIVLAVIICLCAFRRWTLGPSNSHYPSLEGKIVVITGANAGMGFEAAVEMAKLKPKVIVMGCRNKTRGEAAIEKLKTLTGYQDAVLYSLDLGDLESVKGFSNQILANYD